MHHLAITLMSVAGAILYGIVHDLFTAHLCVEYFTVAHPRLIASGDPATLAVFWGIVATWWVGLPLGIALAICARNGRGEPWPAGRLLRPMAVMLGALLAVAALAWAAGYLSAAAGFVRLMPPWDARIPQVSHLRFLGDVWAHLASYFFGALGGILLCVYVRTQRSRAAAR